jgi:hypothetical protein
LGHLNWWPFLFFGGIHMIEEVLNTKFIRVESRAEASMLDLNSEKRQEIIEKLAFGMAKYMIENELINIEQKIDIESKKTIVVAEMIIMTF